MRIYTWLRRLSLLFSWLLVLAFPVWHLRALEVEGAGLAGGGFFGRLAELVPLPKGAPPLLGPPGAIDFFGIELIDPLVAWGVLASRGGSWQLLWVALPALILVLVFGRFFCGWVCPYVPILAVSNSLRWTLLRLGLRLPDARVPRQAAYVLLVGLLAATALSGTQLAPLLDPPSVIGREVFRAVFYGGLGAGSLLVVVAFLFDTFVSRAGFCRSLCPGGALFSVLGAPSPVRIVRDAPSCTDCTVCDVICNLGQLPMTDRLDEGCERCGKCVAACPTGALSIRFGKPALLRGTRERP